MEVSDSVLPYYIIMKELNVVEEIYITSFVVHGQTALELLSLTYSFSACFVLATLDVHQQT